MSDRANERSRIDDQSGAIRAAPHHCSQTSLDADLQPLLPLARVALADSGVFGRAEAAAAVFAPLRGYSNRVLLAHSGHHRAVVKLFGPKHSSKARREWDALTRMSSFGIAPDPLVYRDLDQETASALIISDYVEGTAAIDLLLRDQATRRVLRAFSGGDISAEVPQMPGSADFAAMAAATPASMAHLIAQKLSAAARSQAPGAALALAGARFANAVAVKVESVPGGRLAFCHGDPGFNNAIMLRDGRIVLVDWEDSGSSDPALELVKACYHRANSDRAEQILQIVTGSTFGRQGDESFGQRVTAFTQIVPLALVLRRVEEARRKLAEGSGAEAQIDLARGSRLLALQIGGE